MELRSYPEYKPSGVEWLGEIPEHWEILPFKRLGDFQAGAGFPDEEQGFTDEELPFYKVSDTNLEGNEAFMIVHNNSITRDTTTRLRAFVFPPEAIIFAKVGAALLLNKRRILTRESCIDNNMMGFMRKNCELKWVYYWLCGLDLGRLANPGAVPSINEGQLREIPVPVPSSDEQHAIATFLDQETGRIDALIDKKERQIELLQEKRTALISHVVTKGLNPNVKMKYSGVEWLGEIPEHWTISPLRSLAQPGYKKFIDGDWIESPYIRNEGIRLIQTGNIGVGKYREQGFRYIDEETFHQFRCTEVYPNDILICRLADPVGRACLAPNLKSRMITSVDVCILKPREDVDARFVVYALSSQYYLSWMNAICRGSTRDRISRNMLGAIKVQTPLLDEQRAIAAFLDQETGRIDALAAKISDSITKLREFRTALISAVVTGKIDVREEVVA